ncbi:hypothetical protein C7B71_02645 [Bacillus halotolerans]|uniref:hypothetical protein n=1 Tax=Bacillus halotolerans TaxID=260554 RepID=UPI000D034275|nr:hypothetical protein [Bacillus halotolerans]PRP56863.1 hypothetical protein C7B71_02645 [Bacillus halotolerans]
MAVPQNTILDGKFLDTQELISPSASVIESKKEFQLLDREIKKHIPEFKLADLNIKMAYQADTLTAIEEVAQIELLDFRNKSNTVAVNVLTFNFPDDETKTIYTARIETMAESENYKGFEVVGDEVILKFSQDGEILNFNGVEALPNNPDYSPGNTVTTQALDWIDGKFCLDNEKAGKRYRHCGPGCGDGMGLGGGTPINGLDSCCRAHDRCWKNFGNGDKCCDKTLASCIDPYQGQDYATWLQINTYFQPRGWLC